MEQNEEWIIMGHGVRRVRSMELDISQPLKEKRILERKEWMERFLSKPPKTLETFKPLPHKGYHAPPPRLQPSISLPLSSGCHKTDCFANWCLLGTAMDPSRAFIKDVRRVVVKVMQQHNTTHTHCNILWMQGLEESAQNRYPMVWFACDMFRCFRCLRSLLSLWLLGSN